jgi:hypothetical protein
MATPQWAIAQAESVVAAAVKASAACSYIMWCRSARPVSNWASASCVAFI